MARNLEPAPKAVARSRSADARPGGGIETILATAETLMADKGVDGVSTRAIMAAANVNPGSIHYYFGTKRRLVEEIITLRGPLLSEAINNRLQGFGRTAMRPRHLAEAIVLGCADLSDSESGRTAIRFMSRVRTHRLFANVVRPLEDFSSLYAAAGRAAPHLGDGVRVVVRCNMALALAQRVLTTPASAEVVFRTHLMVELDPKMLRGELIEFISAAFTEFPTPARTRSKSA